MARLELDFADSQQRNHFPAHGWAMNSQGAKILWCPLRRLLIRTLEKRRRLGAIPPEAHLDALPFSETLQKLVTTLRELHQAIRVSCDHPFPSQRIASEDPEAFAADFRAHEMVPLYVDLAFVYLRRLPDLLVVPCRPLLFEHWRSVPEKFKDWISAPDRLATYKPTCTFEVLRDALLDCSWFKELRGVSPVSGKKGIRDALEHRGVRLLVGKQQCGDRRPCFSVTVDSLASDVEIHNDILPRIPESVAGLCRLMSGVHSAIGDGEGYEWWDYLGSVGTDDDLVGYWPQIPA